MYTSTRLIAGLTVAGFALLTNITSFLYADDEIDKGSSREEVRQTVDLYNGENPVYNAAIASLSAPGRELRLLFHDDPGLDDG